MRKNHVQIVMLAVMLLLTFAVVSTNVPAGRLFAFQQGGSNTNQGVETNQSQDPNRGVGSDPQRDTTTPTVQPDSRTNRAETDVNRGSRWAWLIPGFIAGLIVGWLMFRNNPTIRRDRDNLRRSA